MISKASPDFFSSSCPTLSDALEFYLRLKGNGRAKTFVAAGHRNIGYVVEAVGNKPLDQYSRRDALQLRDWFLARGMSGSTITRNFSYIRAVVGVDAGGLLGDEIANYGIDCGTVATGHCLYGTSFAAPVVAGYAAIVGSKFATKDAAMVAGKLLSTTRRDTLKNMGATGWDATDSAYYGQGEACLSCALAPLPASQK